MVTIVTVLLLDYYSTVQGGIVKNGLPGGSMVLSIRKHCIGYGSKLWP